MVVLEGHPPAPSLLFWLDAKVLGGSNHALGLLSVGFALGTVALLNRMLPAHFGPLEQAALTLAFVFLLLSPNATELFGQGMSGISWLPAIFLGVLALLLAHRGRTGPAIAVAALACLCHGTGFALWPALALVAWLRRDRGWAVAAPLGIGALAVTVWLFTIDAGAPVANGQPVGLESYLAAAAAAIGQLWTARVEDLATLLGVATGCALATFVALEVRRRRRHGAQPQAAGWLGLACYILGVVAMVSLSRVETGVGSSLASRYAGISALAMAALLTLVVRSSPRLSTTQVTVGLVSVAIVTFAAGAGQAAGQRNLYPGQEVAAVAMRVGATSVLRQMRILPDVLPAASALGMYPFTDDFRLGCGGLDLGSRLDLASLPELGGATATSTAGPTGGYVDSGPVIGDTRLSGWALIGGRRADCVLVVDSSGTVVGGGTTGTPRPDLQTVLGTSEPRGGWQAVAAPGAVTPVVVVISAGAAYKVTSTARS